MVWASVLPVISVVSINAYEVVHADAQYRQWLRHTDAPTVYHTSHCFRPDASRTGYAAVGCPDVVYRSQASL